MTWFLFTTEPPQMCDPKLLRDTCQGNSSGVKNTFETKPFFLLACSLHSLHLSEHGWVKSELSINS